MQLTDIFRTDLGDDETDPRYAAKEWKHQTQGNGRNDPVGDDDVDVLLKADGTVRVAYRRDGN